MQKALCQPDLRLCRHHITSGQFLSEKRQEILRVMRYQCTLKTSRNRPVRKEIEKEQGGIMKIQWILMIMAVFGLCCSITVFAEK